MNLVKELDVVLLIDRDSEAVGERFTPEVAFIATWQNVIVKTGFLGWMRKNTSHFTIEIIITFQQFLFLVYLIFSETRSN